MAYGVTKLKKVQLGQEGTPGVSAAATALWLGDVKLTDNRTAIYPAENIGYLGQVDRSYIPFTDATADFSEVESNFEQIHYPFAAGISSVVSGAANGGTTNGYKYVYPLATTSAPTQKTFTIEGGDNSQAYKALYGFAEEIVIKGNPKESVKISSKWHAGAMAKATFTGGVAIPTVEQILFQNGKIYADAVGGSLGSTQLTATWLGFDMTIKTGLVPIFTGDGSLAFTFVKCVGPDVTGTITFEHDATGIARYDDFVAGTTKQVRMLFTGSALTGSGGTFSTKALQLDMSMKITSIILLDSVNGNDTVKLNYRAVYNPTANLYWVGTVCNTLAALA